ncbi:MAG TPA: ABC transporter ATP-binding protein [Mucilaginibacter sp.]|nr:ABC transporter ATP-binding protein [Mucilaginibacter sp.]
MAKAIKVENLSKAYQLGDFGTGTISRDLERLWARMRGKEDPFLRIGEVNDRTVKGESDIVWSLNDLNFEIEQGDSVGIIGRNGAGKSTLLKILSRVTSPTTGTIKIKGRIASLLEVGTGFHPELTGKENIYLNGAILGMRRAEIKRKFDEIVDFSGVERYIDTPVKRYSSGMYVRLAFAVAAHLESEILIVDEVLAVGDAEFQKKCLGKMGDVSKGEGRTILFVSHNMDSVKQICRNGILLHNGQIQSTGKALDVVNRYISHSFTRANSRWVNPGNEFSNQYFKPLEFYVEVLADELQNEETDIPVSRNSIAYLVIKGEIESVNSMLQVGFALYNVSGELLFWSFHTDDMNEDFTALKSGELKVKLPLSMLNEGLYRIDLGIAIYHSFWICEPGMNAPSIVMEVEGGYHDSVYWNHRRPGAIAPVINWETNQNI